MRPRGAPASRFELRSVRRASRHASESGVLVDSDTAVRARFARAAVCRCLLASVAEGMGGAEGAGGPGALRPGPARAEPHGSQIVPGPAGLPLRR